MTETKQSRAASATLSAGRFHYLDWENDGAPVLVLLHGITNWSGTWDYFARAMNDRYRVIVPDQRGHGDTEWAPSYSPRAMAQDIAELARALGIDRFALVGHSMGAINAWTLQAAHPEMVERLVLVDFGPDLTSTPTGAAVMAGLLVQRAEVFASPEEAVDAMRRMNPRYRPEDSRRRALARIVQREDGTWVWKYDALGLSKFAENSPPEAEQWAQLAGISCPTLIIRGGTSTTLSPEIADRMAATIPNARLITIPYYGHMVPFENPDAFEAAVRPFLLERFTPDR